MGVNLSAFIHYCWRAERKTLLNLLPPLLGFLICAYLWWSLSVPGAHRRLRLAVDRHRLRRVEDQGLPQADRVPRGERRVGAAGAGEGEEMSQPLVRSVAAGIALAACAASARATEPRAPFCVAERHEGRRRPHLRRRRRRAARQRGPRPGGRRAPRHLLRPGQLDLAAPAARRVARVARPRPRARQPRDLPPLPAEGPGRDWVPNEYALESYTVRRIADEAAAMNTTLLASTARRRGASPTTAATPRPAASPTSTRSGRCSSRPASARTGSSRTRARSTCTRCRAGWCRT